jgi:putative phosphoribosyl transferase
LEEIVSPTLLIVGGEDQPVLAMNKRALLRIPALCELHVVPGATHLFEEPGAMEEVTRAAADWLVKYLQPARTKKTVVA